MADRRSVLRRRWRTVVGASLVVVAVLIALAAAVAPSGSPAVPVPPAPTAVAPEDAEPGAPPRVGAGFDPSDPAYQGSEDPGTAGGREPTSGESQREWGCRQGYITQGC